MDTPTPTAPTAADPPAAVEIPVRPPRRRRVLLWLTLIFVGFLLLIGFVIYTQRLSLVERAFRGALADRGLEAELEVESFDTRALVLRDVRLRENGQDVLSAARIRATYNFREALGGRIRSAEVERARIRIGLDEDFRIVDGWLQPSGEGPGPTLPSEGVSLADSTIDLRTPYGNLEIAVEGRAESPETFTLALATKDAAIAYADIAATLTGTGTLSRAGGGPIAVRGTFTAPRLSAPDTLLEDVAVELDHAFDPEARSVAGTLRLQAPSGTLMGGSTTDLRLLADPAVDLASRTASGGFTLTAATYTRPEGEASDVRLAASPAFGLDFSDGLVPSGPVELSIRDLTAAGLTAGDLRIEADLASARNGTARIRAGRAGLLADRARALAEALTADRVLAVAPLTRDFAPGLTDTLAATLRGGALDGRIAYTLDTTRTVMLLDPLTLRGAQTLRLAPVGDLPAYTHYPDAGQMELRLAASLSGPRALRVRNVQFDAISANGLVPDAVQRLSAEITTEAWEARTPDGRATTLAPTTAAIRYTPDSTAVVGAVAFTGDTPAGYIEGLAAQGRLNVTPGEAIALTFAPDAPITFDRLTLPSGGRVEAFSGELLSTAPVYTGPPESAFIAADLGDVAFDYLFELADGTPEAMRITLADLAAQGQVNGRVQDWALEFSDARLTSDTFIGQGTVATTAEGVASARLDPDAPLAFTFDSPAIQAETALGRATDMPVSLDGTLQDFEVAFGPGRLRSADERLPPARVEGTAVFRDGEWVGQSTTTLIDTPTEPLEVDFQFRDGAGVAEIVFEALRFDPDGGLQPQDYVPALRGKISRVSGPVNGRLTLRFGVGRPLESSGFVELDGLDLGTAPGPVTGLRTRVEFDSLLPMQTSGLQTLFVQRFDPGLPLENGEIVYELLPDGIRIHAATWPLGDGEVRLEPLTWTYAAKVNRAVLVVDGVSLQAFLENYGQENLQATGSLQGRLPVEIRGVNVEVIDGRIEVPDGGRIRYESPQTDTVSAQEETTAFAFDLLRDFRYQSLGLSLNGPLDGEVTVDTRFVGSVPGGRPLPRVPKWLKLDNDLLVEFDIAITGELFNILRNLNPGNILNRVKLQSLEPGDILPADLLLDESGPARAAPPEEPESPDPTEPDSPIQEPPGPLMPGSAADP